MIIPGVVIGIGDELNLTVTDIPILEDSEFGDFDPEAFEKRVLLMMVVKTPLKVTTGAGIVSMHGDSIARYGYKCHT